ncbi:hypothetical protein OF001_U20267 [Pseudomonas sp. OF001]|nr:hypothetical protein OF001_U20267 [Pseudomonas sp. OF001]
MASLHLLSAQQAQNVAQTHPAPLNHAQTQAHHHPATFNYAGPFGEHPCIYQTHSLRGLRPVHPPRRTTPRPPLSPFQKVPPRPSHTLKDAHLRQLPTSNDTQPLAV